MKAIRGFLAERIVEGIRAPGDLETPRGQKAVARLQKIGGPAVRQVIEAMDTAEADRASALARVLGTLVSTRTLHDIVSAMPSVNVRGLQGITWALSHARDYNPNRVLDYLTEASMPRGALMEILDAQEERLHQN